MCNTKYFSVAPVVLSVLLGACAPQDTAEGATDNSTKPPRLILQITVDQFRGELPFKYLDRLGPGGLRYLIDNGVVYTDAHHQHANTETIVGHATLATGAQPSEHGMIGNVWFDHETGKLTYNIEDDRYHLLTSGAGVDQDTEIDPTQAVASSDGRSPSAILVSTFSDELAAHYNGQAKVFGVSVKDRGAVSMAGHVGKAFWFSKATGEFVTSSYYYDRYPDWVVQWNEKGLPFDYADTTWDLLNDRSSYLFGEDDDNPWETDLAGFGRTFPHSFGAADSPYFTTFLTITPAGDELTADFAKTLIANEELGADTIPDFLAVSFSSTDYVGHIFGPSSLEGEENIIRLDRTLADLFSYIDQQIGLENTLIVLSADHGAPEAPGYLNSLGIPANYVDPKSWDKAPAIEALKSRFNIGEELIETYFQPYLYLNRSIIEENGLDQAEVEATVAAEVEKMPGVAYAISSTAIRAGNLPVTPVIQKIMNNFHPKRSGEIYIVFKANYFINDMDGLIVAAVHGSPWQYDTHVPIMFAGPGIQAQRVSREVHAVDIARTLAEILGTKIPSAAYGDVLIEVVNQR